MTKSNWSRWWKRSSDSLGSGRMRYWPITDIARRSISKRWRRATSTDISRRAGRSMRLLWCPTARWRLQPSMLATFLIAVLLYGYGRTFLSRTGALAAGAAYATFGEQGQCAVDRVRMAADDDLTG